ncbi:MAG: hypothetical protein AAGF32_10785, partial [Pseudomonadota bacterium]
MRGKGAARRTAASASRSKRAFPELRVTRAPASAALAETVIEIPAPRLDLARIRWRKIFRATAPRQLDAYAFPDRVGFLACRLAAARGLALAGPLLRPGGLFALSGIACIGGLFWLLPRLMHGLLTRLGSERFRALRYLEVIRSPASQTFRLV